MSNNSSVRGYLTPVGDLPKYDEALEREISRWISGVSGLPAALVFPRWVDPQPPTPNNGMTWCAFGITTEPQPLSQSEVQISDAQSEQWSWETLSIICCFYGPLSASTAATFHAGIFVEQNNAELNLSGFSLVEAGTFYNQPELINDQWVRRYDITVTLSRKNTRLYNIKSLVDASAKFFGD